MKRLAIAASVILLTGCSTKLVHKKFSDTSAIEDAGIIYALPKQKITVEYAYELTDCHDHLPGNPTGSKAKPGEFTFRRTATVSAATEPDWSHRYLLPYRKMTRGNKAVTLNTTLYNNGTLKSVGATFDDRTAEIIGNVIKSAASVAKLAFGPTSGYVPSQTCTVKALNALARIRSLTNSLNSDAPILTDKQRASAESALARNKSIVRIKKRYSFTPDANRLNTLHEQLTLAISDYSGLVDPNAVNRVQDPKKRDQFLKTTICVEPGDGVLLEKTDNASTGGYCEKVVAPDTRTQSTKNATDGVIYRDPISTRIRICKGDCKQSSGKTMLSTPAYIAQLGPTRRITLKSRAFQDANISAQFDTAGRLTSLTHGSSSALEAASGALAAATAQAQSSYSEFQNRETVEAEAELKLLKAQADAIEQRRRLEKLLEEENAEE